MVKNLMETARRLYHLIINGRACYVRLSASLELLSRTQILQLSSQGFCQLPLCLHMWFHNTTCGAALDLEDTMEIPTLHHKLRQRDSPFVATNYYGGGFVDDDDRVSLSSIHFASSESTGATDRCRPRTNLVETVDEDVRSPFLDMHLRQDVLLFYSRGIVTVRCVSVQWLCLTGVLLDSTEDLTGANMQEECELMPTWAIRAGARRKIYFEPSAVTAAIVTCGGLCPGLNDVVQGLVQKLADYGVPEGGILGIRCVKLS